MREQWQAPLKRFSMISVERTVLCQTYQIRELFNGILAEDEEERLMREKPYSVDEFMDSRPPWDEFLGVTQADLIYCDYH